MPFDRSLSTSAFPSHLVMRPDQSEIVSYDDPDFPAYIRRGCLSSYSNYSEVSHWHQDLEFIVILSGSMNFRVDTDKITLHPGEGLMVNSRHFHFGFSADRTECEFLVLLLHPLLLCLTQEMAASYVTPIIRNEALPYLLLSPKTDWQKQILDLLRVLYFQPSQKARCLQIESSFFSIWMILSEHLDQIQSSKIQKEQASGYLTQVRDMTLFINTHYARKISLDQIASAGHVGLTLCCDLFHRYVGETPVSYLNHYRLGKSIRMLRRSDLSVGQIADACGFGSASYFTRLFKARYGVSPLQYRKGLTYGRTEGL